MRRPTPQPEVLVRFARTEAFEDPVLAARARQILGPAERETLARLRPSAAARDYLAAHALARTMLAEQTGADPGELCFHTSRRGRPELVARGRAPTPRFSISHAEGVAVCAVTQRWEVGVDVESLRNVGRDPLGVAGTICSPRELEALRALPASARAAHLLAIWTLKEAVAKATGLGLYLPLERISVDEEVDGPLRVELDAAADAGLVLRPLACLRLTPDHLAAVAVLAAPGQEISIRVEEHVGVGRVAERLCGFTQGLRRFRKERAVSLHAASSDAASSSSS
jgi:4'-phosphopantetheinyl transferase